MDIATLAGFVSQTVFVLITMLLSGSLLMYWDLPSLMIVVGGAIGSVMMRWPIGIFFGGIGAAKKVLIGNVAPPTDLIGEIVELANTARKGSILALEKVEITDPFLAKAVKFMVDGYDEENINEVLEVEIFVTKQQNKYGKAVYDNLGEAAPAFGMIGTVVGLIVIMANLNDPSKIGPGLAVALVTTLYGSLIANAVFIPIGQKIGFLADSEQVNMMIIKTGVNGILKGENPRALAEKLRSYLDAKSKGETAEE